VIPTDVATATVGPGSPPAGTGLTVGALADRIGAAWPSVATYRAVTTVDRGAATEASPAADASLDPARPVVETTDEFVLPDRKRRIVRADGELRYEVIAIADRVYARGADAPWLDPARSDPDAWVAIDPAAGNAGVADAQDYREFVAPVAAPYSALSPEERGRDAVLVGPATVDGRSCSDTTNTGERIEIVLALGDDDLPCAIETRVGGLVTTTIFIYNLPLTIEAPKSATPVPGGP
jgi:hypothetical protein